MPRLYKIHYETDRIAYVRFVSSFVWKMYGNMWSRSIRSPTTCDDSLTQKDG